jgi:deazaflavin-dependent oxidoreductase (nitroreductase family)
MAAGGSNGAATGGPDRPAFRMTRGRRIGDAVTGVLIRAGVVPNSYMLTTKGRKTGRLRTTPVTLVERDGRRWLVAPYGPVSWVHNARAAGRVSLQRRGHRLECAVREVPPEEAGPVLKDYIKLARPTRPYFDATPDAPVEHFVAEADRHPVFELTLDSQGR